MACGRASPKGLANESWLFVDDATMKGSAWLDADDLATVREKAGLAGIEGVFVPCAEHESTRLDAVLRVFACTT